MSAGTLTIRAARPADLTALDQLFAASYPALLKPDYPPSVLVTALPLISKANPRLLRSGTYFVAEREGRILGAGGWTPGSPQGLRRRRSVGHIRHVVTDHREVRQGIGRALMARVFETARAAGVRTLDCLSTRTAVPFYAACGFREVGPVEVELRPGIGFPAIQMVAEL